MSYDEFENDENIPPDYESHIKRTQPAANKVAKKKEFKSSLSKFYIASLVVAVVYIIVLIQVRAVMAQLPPNDELRVIGLIFLIATGLIIFAFIGNIFLTNRTKSIIISPETMEYIHGDTHFEAKWRAVIFTPSSTKSILASIYQIGVINAGKKHGYVDNLFFDKYDTICKLIELASGTAKNRELEL